MVFIKPISKSISGVNPRLSIFFELHTRESLNKTDTLKGKRAENIFKILTSHFGKVTDFDS